VKIAVTGSSGLVGQAFARVASEKHEVVPVVRRDAQSGEIFWRPSEGKIDAEAFASIDAVLHLAGESIADGRWSEAKKKSLLESRTQGTTLLASTLAQLDQGPRVFVSASAIGYYGDRGDEVLTVDSDPGEGFLPKLCQAWEAAADPARKAGVRVAHPRISIALSRKGGALSKMLTPFKMCVGGKVGDGKQYWSWIALEDLARALLFAIEQEQMVGPFNAASPNPVTNIQFTKALGKVLGRPTIFPMPAFAARLALGEMADELLLASAQVKPEKLLAAGFEFNYPHLEEALKVAMKT